jgi:hypothetical protein
MIRDPIFLICTERSGSNLLRAIMNSHSSIYAPMPVHLGLIYWTNIHRYGDLTKDENWSTLLKHVSHHLNSSLGKLDVEISQGELFESVKERNFKSVYEYIYTKGMRQAGKSRLFIKDNQCHKQLYYFLHYFPEAKFVFQVRDPRDYILSCKKLMHYINFFNALDVWKSEQEATMAMMYALPKDKIFVLRYEDLLARPENVLKSACSFMGVPFESQMLDFHNMEHAKKASARSIYWENLNKPIIDSNTGKFRNGLNRIQIYHIEHSLSEWMDRFGYVPTIDKSRIGKVAVPLLSRSRLLRFFSSAWWALRSRRSRNLLRYRLYVNLSWVAHLVGRRTRDNKMLFEIDELEKKVRYSYEVE